MKEGRNTTKGQDIVLKDVKPGAFQVLLEFLYAHRFPEEEDCGQGLGTGEMVRVADRFQADELYKHCMRQFQEGLRVDNVAERLVLAHDSGLKELKDAAIVFLKDNAYSFQVSCHGVIILCVRVRAYVLACNVASALFTNAVRVSVGANLQILCKLMCCELVAHVGCGLRRGAEGGDLIIGHIHSAS